MRATARAASARFSAPSASCSSGVASSWRLPYKALNARQPVRSPIAVTTSRLARRSAERAGHDTRPRSPPGMFPASKLSPVSCTPAASIAPTNASTSSRAGVDDANGHQNSTPRKPAAAAAAGRSSSGRSVSRIEQFTVYVGAGLIVSPSVVRVSLPCDSILRNFSSAVWKSKHHIARASTPGAVPQPGARKRKGPVPRGGTGPISSAAAFGPTAPQRRSRRICRFTSL